jgi:hypothetical protein
MLWKFTRFRQNELASDDENKKILARRNSQREMLDAWHAYWEDILFIKWCVQAYSYEKFVRFENFVFLMKNDDSDVKITKTWNLKKTWLEVIWWCKLASHCKRIFVWSSSHQKMLRSHTPLAYSARILRPHTPPAYSARILRPHTPQAWKPTDENPQMKTHRWNPQMKTHRWKPTDEIHRWKSTDENSQMKIHRWKLIRKTHTQNSYRWKSHTDENLIQVKTSYRWKPHTGENPIQVKTPYRWKPHTDENPIQMKTPYRWKPHTDENLIQMKIPYRWKSHTGENPIQVKISYSRKSHTKWKISFATRCFWPEVAKSLVRRSGWL